LSWGQELDFVSFVKNYWIPFDPQLDKIPYEHFMQSLKILKKKVVECLMDRLKKRDSLLKELEV
jgi:hypothetical protein